MKVTTGVNIFGTAFFLPILVLGLIEIAAVRGTFDAPIVHLVGVLMITVASIVFWYYAGHAFRITGSFRLLIIALGLLFGGLLLLTHAIFSMDSFEYPAFFGRSEWYLRLAFLTMSLSLLMAVGFAERTVATRDRRRTILAISFLFLVLLVIAAFVVEGALVSGISVAATTGRWTPLGRFLQVASIMFFTVAALRYLHGAFMIRSEIALAFATGSVLFVIGELTYALGSRPYDAFFWASHLWYIMGFLAFVWGSYAGRITHHEDDGLRILKGKHRVP